MRIFKLERYLFAEEFFVAARRGKTKRIVPPRRRGTSGGWPSLFGTNLLPARSPRVIV